MAMYGLHGLYGLYGLTLGVHTFSEFFLQAARAASDASRAARQCQAAMEVTQYLYLHPRLYVYLDP